MLALDDANVDTFITCAQRLGLKPQAPVPLESLKIPLQRKERVASKRMIAFALNAPGASAATVDVLIHHPLDIDAALARAAVRQVDDVPVTLCAIDDLIALKQGTGRRQDESDIEHLRRIRKETP